MLLIAAHHLGQVFVTTTKGGNIIYGRLLELRPVGLVVFGPGTYNGRPVSESVIRRGDIVSMKRADR